MQCHALLCQGLTNGLKFHTIICIFPIQNFNAGAIAQFGRASEWHSEGQRFDPA